MHRFPQKPPKKSSVHSGNQLQNITNIKVTKVITQASQQKFQTGRLQAANLVLRCSIGLGELKFRKREGDGATPKGAWRILEGFYRAGRLRRPNVRFPLRPLRKDIGWCDDPRAAVYNRAIKLPSAAGHELLWREDNLYDLILILDYNINPRVKNRGSAIFLHCCRPGFAPTEGCIALERRDLERLLPRLSATPVIKIS